MAFLQRLKYTQYCCLVLAPLTVIQRMTCLYSDHYRQVLLYMLLYLLHVYTYYIHCHVLVFSVHIPQIICTCMSKIDSHFLATPKSSINALLVSLRKSFFCQVMEHLHSIIINKQRHSSEQGMRNLSLYSHKTDKDKQDKAVPRILLSLAVPPLRLEEEGSGDTHILNPFCRSYRCGG